MNVNRTTGHFFGYFLWGLAKKVPRLPAGTGELDVKILHSALSTAPPRKINPPVTRR